MPIQEWRVFFPCSHSDTQPGAIWSLLGAKQPQRFNEHRTDVYLTCTAGVGLKLRGESQLVEVKLRKDIDSVGSEDWKKVLRTSFPSGIDGKDPTAVADVFAKELRRIQSSIDKSLKRSLDEAFVALSLPQQLVTVSKARIKQGLRRVSIDSVEEVIVSVTTCDGRNSRWRTVSMEAFSTDDVNSTLSTKVKVCPPGKPADTPKQEMSLGDYLLGLGGRVLGYPEFVLERVGEDKSVSK